MKLLSPEDTKVRASKAEEDRAARVRGLNKAEADSIKRLNNSVAAERVAAERVAAERVAARATLAVKKTVLEKEVEVLEERKRTALEPVDAAKREYEKLIEEANAGIADIKRRQTTLDERRDELETHIDALADQEGEALEKDRTLDVRESGIKAAEDEIARSATALGEKWASFHNESNEANEKIAVKIEELREREKDVEIAARTNKLTSERLGQFEKELRALETDVKDRYSIVAKHLEKLGLKIL
jgi:chromosome segregation ATPase